MAIYLKKSLIFLLSFAGIIFVANLAVGASSLIMKLTLVTVQGPTTFSVIIGITTFFSAIAIGAFLWFKSMGKRKLFSHLSELGLYMSMIIILQILVVFFGDFNTLSHIATGTLSLTEIFYLGGIGYIESLREIPREYYFLSLMIEDGVFFLFSWLGLLESKGGKV